MTVATDYFNVSIGLTAASSSPNWQVSRLISSYVFIEFSVRKWSIRVFANRHKKKSTLQDFKKEIPSRQLTHSHTALPMSLRLAERGTASGDGHGESLSVNFDRWLNHLLDFGIKISLFTGCFQ